MSTDALDRKKKLKELQAELKRLQAALADAQKREGKGAAIEVRVKKNQGRFERIRKKGAEDKAVGKYYLEIAVTATESEVFIPVSIASGKKVAGLMYVIEGTGEGSLATASVKARGEGISHVTVGTLVYAKIPKGATALFQIQAMIRGKFGKQYRLIITRLNYKFSVTDARYQQYLQEISTEKVVFA